MPQVPERFYIAGTPPRPAEVTSVTPARIYLEVGGDGDDGPPDVIELDRPAWVDGGRIVVAAPGREGWAPLLTADAETAATAAESAVRGDLAEAEARVRLLKRRIAELQEELDEAKRRRKRLRRRAG
jgi:uncharacterized protein YceH (UPF0502 family)